MLASRSPNSHEYPGQEDQKHSTEHDCHDASEELIRPATSGREIARLRGITGSIRDRYCRANSTLRVALWRLKRNFLTMQVTELDDRNIDGVLVQERMRGIDSYNRASSAYATQIRLPERTVVQRRCYEKRTEPRSGGDERQVDDHDEEHSRARDRSASRSA